MQLVGGPTMSCRKLVLAGILLAATAGFAQVEGDTVSILAEQAINEAKIDEQAVEAALKRAEEELKNAPKDLDSSELERLQNTIRFAGVQLALKRRVR